MKRNKIVLAVLALVLSSVMFMACGTPANLSKDKYTSIVGAVGSTVIVSDGSKMNLLDSKGKKTGDSAYEIKPIYLSNVFTGFYQAKREAKSGLELMGEDGRFLQASEPADKAISIEAVGVVSKDDNGFNKIEVNAFVVKTNRSTDPYVVMAKNGDRATAFYKTMSGNYGSVITAAKESNNVTTQFALKTDGTTIASSTDGVRILSLENPGDVLIEVTKKEVVNQIDKYSYEVYSKAGTKIGTYDYSGYLYGKVYLYSVTTTESTTNYYIDENGAKALASDVLSGYTYDGEYYVKVGTTSDFRIRKINSTTFITSALESAVYNYNGLLIVKEKGADKYKMLRPDTGAVLLDNLTASNPTINYFNENDDKTYTLLVTDGTSLTYSANGTKKTRTLEANESYVEHYSGAVKIQKYVSYNYIYSLWIPATDENVELASYGSVSSANGIISFTVKGEDTNPDVNYATLAQNLKSWNGSVSNNNLYFQIGVPSSAFSYSITSYGSSSTAQILMAKSDDYTSVKKVKDAYKAGTVTYRTISVAYKATENSANKYISAMVYADSKGNANFIQLGEEYSVSLISSSAYFYKTRTGERTIHEFYLDNGEVKIRDIASDLSWPTLMTSSSGKAYVLSTLNNGRNELYDLDKNLLLPANYCIKGIYNDLIIVSAATGSGNALGVVRLEKNGKHKLLKQIEYTSIAILTDGTMMLEKNAGDAYVELCDKDGKTVEAKVFNMRQIAFNINAEQIEIAKNITAGGERKIITNYAIALSDGTERLLSITVSEDDLNFSIMNLLYSYI